MKYLVYYNKAEDQLYITCEDHIAWFRNDVAFPEVLLDELFIIDNRYWYYIGEL